MNPRYARYGMTTALGGIENQTGAFELRVRALKSGALALNLDEDTIHLAADIAALDPGLDDERRFAVIVLVTISLASLQEGNTRFPVTGDAAREPMRRMLAGLIGDRLGADGPAAIAGEIECMLESGVADTLIGRRADEYKPLLYLAPYLYQQKIHHAERRLAEAITRLAASRSTIGETEIARAVDDVASRPSTIDGRAMILSAEQRAAVSAAARFNLSVVSGGPGTGKTTIVLALLRTLARLGFTPNDFALAAPTGKAAYRLGEAVCGGLARIASPAEEDLKLGVSPPEPSTIHRLLGYSQRSGRFRHHRKNPLLARVVIVDECSMIDLTLMERLAGAIVDGAKLVMLGDADQLPSVAAGAVFRELAPHDGKSIAGASVTMTHNYRTDDVEPGGRAILNAAAAINRGEDISSAMEFRDSVDALRMNGVEFLKIADARSLGPFLDRWYSATRSDEVEPIVNRAFKEGSDGFEPEDIERLKWLFDRIARARILTVTRVFDTGSDAINERMHRRAPQSLGDRAPRDRSALLPGEPLIVLRNDYERMLFNGDQGVVLNVQRNAAAGREIRMAVFARGDRFVAFPLDTMRDVVELCYTTTVHKAQGSEFDRIALLLPGEDLPILAREIVYTAVSRSRKSVVILGNSALLNAAIARPTERFCGLGDAI